MESTSSDIMMYSLYSGYLLLCKKLNSFVVIYSLGAAHDSDGNNCPNNTGYVMEASSGVGGDPVENLRLWEFSTCSVDYFNIFSTGLNRYVKAFLSCKV